jgi:hypothetical protein
MPAEVVDEPSEASEAASLAQEAVEESEQVLTCASCVMPVSLTVCVACTRNLAMLSGPLKVMDAKPQALLPLLGMMETSNPPSFLKRRINPGAPTSKGTSESKTRSVSAYPES